MVYLKVHGIKPFQQKYQDHGYARTHLAQEGEDYGNNEGNNRAYQYVDQLSQTTHYKSRGNER